jgi:hypothetical protein
MTPPRDRLPSAASGRRPPGPAQPRPPADGSPTTSLRPGHPRHRRRAGARDLRRGRIWFHRADGHELSCLLRLLSPAYELGRALAVAAALRTRPSCRRWRSRLGPHQGIAGSERHRRTLHDRELRQSLHCASGAPLPCDSDDRVLLMERPRTTERFRAPLGPNPLRGMSLGGQLFVGMSECQAVTSGGCRASNALSRAAAWAPADGPEGGLVAQSLYLGDPRDEGSRSCTMTLGFRQTRSEHNRDRRQGTDARMPLEHAIICETVADRPQHPGPAPASPPPPRLLSHHCTPFSPHAGRPCGRPACQDRTGHRSWSHRLQRPVDAEGKAQSARAKALGSDRTHTCEVDQ